MFSELEADEKTFTYATKYLEYYSSEGSPKENLDNQITIQELRWHTRQQPGYTQEEVAAWIVKNGKAFRAYLNTIKLIVLIHSCNSGTAPLTWERFLEIREALNRMKARILDSIFVEDTKPSMLQGCID